MKELIIAFVMFVILVFIYIGYQSCSGPEKLRLPDGTELIFKDEESN